MSKKRSSVGTIVPQRPGGIAVAGMTHLRRRSVGRSMTIGRLRIFDLLAETVDGFPLLGGASRKSLAAAAWMALPLLKACARSGRPAVIFMRGVTRTGRVMKAGKLELREMAADRASAGRPEVHSLR